MFNNNKQKTYKNNLDIKFIYFVHIKYKINKKLIQKRNSFLMYIINCYKIQN